MTAPGLRRTAHPQRVLPGEDELPDDWKPPKPPPTHEELVRTEGQWLYFACHALLIHSGILERGAPPRRKIPETPGELLAYADELVAFCRKTGRVKEGAIFDVEHIERRSSTLRWLLEGQPID